MAVRLDLALGLADQDLGDAGSALGSRDVHLLDLVVDDHYEPDDGSVDGGYGRVRDAFRRPCPERSFGPNVHELSRHEPEMAVLPAETPDLSDRAGVLQPRRAKRDIRSVRDHQAILRAAGRGSCRGYVESGGMRRPPEEHSISVASRRARVSGRLALTTQNVARLRYEGDWAENHSHAGAFA